jgi:hypothetical protein
MASASVAVTVVAGLTPWHSNDYSLYTTLGTVTNNALTGPGWGVGGVFALGDDRYTRRPGGFFGHQNDDQNPSKFQLMTGQSDGPPGGSTQYLRYNWPAVTCTNYTIRTNVQLPNVIQEYWAEDWVRFSANYSVGVFGACPGSNGYKFLLGRVNGPIFNGPIGTNRFDFLIAVGQTADPNVGGGIETGSPGGPIPPCISEFPSGRVKPSQYFDGNWHRWRRRYKLSATYPATTGAIVIYMDNLLVHNLQNIGAYALNQYGYNLGANNNYGTPVAATCDWGLHKIWLSNPGWAEAGF